MNYLAHSTLAEDSEEARLGSLLGDFSKGLDVERLTPTMRFALEEHRAVDAWFDALPEIREERRSYPPHLRRFAGILTDVFFDHFLVRRWSDLCDRPMESVTSSLYRALEVHAHVLPPRLREVAPSMIERDWLGSYGDIRNIERALHGIDRRMRRSTPITEGIDVLHRRGEELEALVLEVFPRVRAFTEERRALLR
ncbi:Acyl carrier protein phosphodiesterase [Planctomycetes bacterium Poly30]|uniref:Acyl carrier protein phosphodiesterase n=1 Tax=Saltatorellus ferox TaxID=2528018 RepID=A0A518EMF0_9BACT|nr:Acyl carrier protein phosphodiesterase [Planctomycetes bacterium Poly30]